MVKSSDFTSYDLKQINLQLPELLFTLTSQGRKGEQILEFML
jgi:hypothetical protein